MTASTPSALAQLAIRCGRSWPTMTKAVDEALRERERLAAKLTGARLVPTDTSMVVFGSLARGEWTRGSDLDWTLLIDGAVEAEHTNIARAIADTIKEESKEPGPSGVFGGLTFSHDIVHFIGGDNDSNTNTTRRILLLLESRSLLDDAVRVRVLRALLSRYVGEDLLYHRPADFLVPRFLLNDYVRYWRTMAVDSAQKRRDRGDKWALRNIKLRLSRKLIFTAGLWACLRCKVKPSEELSEARKHDDRAGVDAAMTDLLFEASQRTPLETVAQLFLDYNAMSAATKTFDAYEEFLSLLDDGEARNHLEKLKVGGALADETFNRAKHAAGEFHEGLSALFFNTDEHLTSATQRYGVF